MVYVVRDATENGFHARSITSLTRVAKQTKKTLVLASEHEGQIRFIMWKWFRPALKQKQEKKESGGSLLRSKQEDQGGLSDAIL
jgi:hypothetical protein